MEPTKVELDILAAARELFMEKGFAATSTTDIARKAGCNQALVHYYYRTKEKLFERIYTDAVTGTLSMISHVLDEPVDSLTMEDMVNNVIDVYFGTLRDNPRLPFFLVQELLLNPDRREFIREHFIHNDLRREAYSKYVRLVEKLQTEGRIRAIEPFDLLVNVVSLVAGTFLSLPIYAGLLEKTPAEQTAYLDGRKKEIKTVILSRLLP